MKLIENKSVLLMFGILTAMVLVLSSCNEEDVTPDNLPTENIMGLVDQSTNLSTLKAAIDAASLRATLTGDGPFTVFAPTNEAFAAVDADVLAYLLATPAELTKVLTYHVVAGKVMSTDLANGSVETLNGGSVTVDLSNGVKINDATVTEANVEATNGVVHIIDQVLIPENLDLSGMDMGPESNIAELAIATDDLSVLVDILSLPALSDILAAAADDNQTLTVFAPTNAAFQGVLDALGLTSIDEIPESVLLDIVQYHIIGSVAKSTDLQSTTYATLNGESVTVDLSNGVSVDDATVVQADIEATNGVVHVVDAVLLPSLYKSALGTIVEVPLFRKSYSTLTAALVKAELVETLLGDGPFTVFAPNNDAFAAANITSLENLTKEDLTPILLYHVLGAEVKAADLPAEGGAVATLNEAFANIYLSVGDDVFINGQTKVTATDIVKSNGVIHTIDQTLVPPSMTIAGLATDLGFTKLVEALVEAGLDQTFVDPGNYTVFAPTNEAFDALYATLQVNGPAEVDNATLEAVLKYHVINARVFSTDLSDGLAATTLEGGNVTVNISNGTVTLTDNEPDNADATVAVVDKKATNGVVHAIDAVLLPVDL